MEEWRRVWRGGFAPVLPTAGLQALAVALRNDDPRLTQGSTTTPLNCVANWPCEAADAIALCGWHGGGLTIVGEVSEFFACTCFECDQLLGEPAASHWFLEWFDDTPRGEMRAELLAEVERELLRRRLSSGLCTDTVLALLRGPVICTPVLADALQDAGMDETDVTLADLRSGNLRTADLLKELML